MPIYFAKPKNVTKVGRIDFSFALASIKGSSEAAAFEAAKQLRIQTDVSLLLPRVHVLEHGRRAMNRAAAAYALAEVADANAIAALERVVANKFEDPKVRGYAAEALAHQHRPQSHRVLLNNLSDGCEEVRFWCAFALGEMVQMDTLPLLESLTKAKRVRGTHATGAIGDIQQKLGSTCQFCIAS